VLIDGPGDHTLPAQLLFDTGCSMEVVLSKYKAEELGLQPEPTVTRGVQLPGKRRTSATR
jgi:hypothetical protein